MSWHNIEGIMGEGKLDDVIKSLQDVANGGATLDAVAE